MDPTIFLIVGLGIGGFVWLLSFQMRGLCVKALSVAAQDKFPDVPPADVRLASKATPLEGTLDGAAGQVQVWLKETYPPAVRHLALARRASLFGPVLLLGVVLIWRFVLGGGA